MPKSRSHCRRVLLCVMMLAVFTCTASAWAAQSAGDVAKELANPNTALGFLAFPIDYTLYDGDLPDADDQDGWRLSLQPSLPYPITKEINLFLRPLIPIILDQPVPKDGGFESKGVALGDISFDAAIGKGFASGLQLIGGIAGTLPTATDDDLGGDQLRLGPEFFVGSKFKWGFLGVLVSHQWDIAGDDYPTSITAGQYFYTINLKNAWQIQAQPTWSYNHEADSGNRLTLPLGTGISKTIIAGKTPLKFSLQYWHYIETPDAFGPRHQIRFQIAPVVPLPW